MKKHKPNTNIEWKQLQQYVAGKATFAQQHKVEKATLENDFVADALEGVTAMQADNINQKATFEDLRQRIQQRTKPQQKKTLPIWYYASAAVVLIAVGLGWIWQTNGIDGEAETPKVAKVKATENSPIAAIIDSTKLMAIATPKKQENTVPSPTNEALREAVVNDTEITQNIQQAPPSAEETVIAAEEKIAQLSEKSPAILPKHPDITFSDTMALAEVFAPKDTYNLRINAEQRKTILAPILANFNSISRNTVIIFHAKDPIPTIGIARYAAYLDSVTHQYKLQNPTITDTLIMVSFNIGRENKLSDFSFEPAVATKFQEDVINMIQQSPIWQIRDKRKRRATIILKF